MPEQEFVVSRSRSPLRTGDVPRGGGRGRRGLAIALVVGLVGFGVGVALRNWSEPQDVRLLQATKGDLATDSAKLLEAGRVWQAAVTPEWRAERRITGLRGTPHAYWAGRTPAGDAVVVMQEARIDDRWRTVVGLIGPDPYRGEPTLIGSTNPDDPVEQGDSFQFGVDNRTFLVLDRATPVYLSRSADRNADGRPHRTWTLLPMTDGVGVWTAPEDPTDVRFVADVDPPTSDVPADRLLRVRSAFQYLPWGLGARATGTNTDKTSVDTVIGPGIRLVVGTQADPPPLPVDLAGAVREAGMNDIGQGARAGTWRIRGRLPNGEYVVLGECLQGGSPSTLYAVVLHSDGTVDRVLRGPAVDFGSDAPIRMRLANGQGWVVAAMWRHLRYRTSADGEWQGDFTSAALLPDEAVQVLVTPTGSGPAEVVDLTG